MSKEIKVNENDNELKNIVKKYLNKFDKQKELEKEFIEQKKYIELMDFVTNKELDNDDYQDPTKWTDEINMLFDFLYDNAQEIGTCFDEDWWDDEIVIKYKDKYVSLLEIHGQGCYRRLAPANPKNLENCVSFEDIVKYVEEGVKPVRTVVLETTNMALNSLKIMVDNYDLDVNIADIKRYLKDNLK